MKNTKKMLLGIAFLLNSIYALLLANNTDVLFYISLIEFAIGMGYILWGYSE